MNYYELGKWLGDRRGYPRVGIVNTEWQLIEDTTAFLRSEFGREPICRKITRKENPGMKGKFVYETFIVDGALHRQLESQVLALNPTNLKKKQILSFIAGFIDAEGTIDLKNQQVVVSIGKKNERVKELIWDMFTMLGWYPRLWTCNLEWKISSKANKKIISALRKYVHHPKKQELLFGGIPKADEKYLKFIKKEGNITAQQLSKKFEIHIDSARRILRFFESVYLIQRINNRIPYKFAPVEVP